MKRFRCSSFRQVKKELDDSGTVTVEMLLHVHDRPIPLFPDSFLVKQFIRKPLAAENLRMHTNDEHFLIVGTIEDTDPPTFRQTTGRAPEKNRASFRRRARLFETENLTALRIDPGHDMPDRAVLAGCVHCLKYQ